MGTHDDEQLLRSINAIYTAALSPDQYDQFAEELDEYVAQIDRGEQSAKTALTHIEQALTVIDRLHFANQDDFDPAAIVSRQILPAVIIQADGKIIEKNGPWRDLSWLSEKRLWDLAATDAERDNLRASIRTLHEIAEAPANFASVTEPATGMLRQLAFKRLPDIGQSRAGGALFLVRLAHSGWSDVTVRFVTRDFDLTAAEAQLLRAIVEGKSFADIAEETGRARETLKAQSKAIYRKMGVSGREDAVRVVLQLHMLFDGTPRNLPASTTFSTRSFLTLPDRRRLAWTKKGAEAGDPFIFLHGMSVGHGMTRAFIDGLKARNLTAYCLDRPGYGESDPPRDWQQNVEDWVKLFPDILDGLDLVSVPVVTHTSGVMYACAAAAAHKGRVRTILALAGGVPIVDRDSLSAYPTQVRLLSRTARLSPKAVRFVTMSAAAFYRGEVGKRRLIERTYAHAPSDVKALRDPEIFSLMSDGMTLVANSGLDGFVGDALRIFDDWSGFPASLDCQLTYLIGEDDPICPLDWAQAFAQKYAHVSVESIPGAGQLLHHTHQGQILDMIARCVTRPESSPV